MMSSMILLVNLRSRLEMKTLNFSKVTQKKKTEPADGSGPKLEDQLPEEKHGLAATLVMEIDLCKADKESTCTKADIDFFSAIARRPMGELSRYKGFEHVNDDLPVVTQNVLMAKHALPTDYDLR